MIIGDSLVQVPELIFQLTQSLKEEIVEGLTKHNRQNFVVDVNM